MHRAGVDGALGVVAARGAAACTVHVWGDVLSQRGVAHRGAEANLGVA